MRRWLAFLALALSGFFATGLAFGMNSPELQGLTSYDALNRATEAATITAAGGWVHDQQTAHDQAGNVTRLKEDFFTAAIAPRTTVNTYDGANRLLGESATQDTGARTASYSYDAGNNRNQRVVVTTPAGGSAANRASADRAAVGEAFSKGLAHGCPIMSS